VANYKITWLIGRTFSVKEQCFSLTANQSIVIFNLTFQQSEQTIIVGSSTLALSISPSLNAAADSTLSAAFSLPNFFGSHCSLLDSLDKFWSPD
jgi:hypothetical protein